MNIQATVAKLLGKRDTLASKECSEQIKAINERLAEIRARDKDISSDRNGRGDFIGATRQRISLTGTPEDLIKLNTEEQLIEAEDISLCSQRDALQEREKKAVIEEAPTLVKAAIKKLPAALKAAESTKAAYDHAITSLEGLHIEISTARRIALHDGQSHAGPAPQGLSCPAVTLEQFERLAHMLRWYKEDQPAIVGNNRAVIQRNRLALTDYKPDRIPVFQDQSDHAIRQRAADRKGKAYVNKSNVPEVHGG